MCDNPRSCRYIRNLRWFFSVASYPCARITGNPEVIGQAPVVETQATVVFLELFPNTRVFTFSLYPQRGKCCNREVILLVGVLFGARNWGPLRRRDLPLARALHEHHRGP